MLSKRHLTFLYLALGLMLSSLGSPTVLNAQSASVYVEPYRMYSRFRIEVGLPGTAIGAGQLGNDLDAYLSLGLLAPQFAISDNFTVGLLMHGLTRLQRTDETNADYRVISLVTSHYYIGHNTARPKVGLGVGAHTSFNELSEIKAGIAISPRIGVDIAAARNIARSNIGYFTATLAYNFVLGQSVGGFGSLGVSWTFGGGRIPPPPDR